MSTEIDWSKAPEGAAYYFKEDDENFEHWLKVDGDLRLVWCEKRSAKWVVDEYRDDPPLSAYLARPVTLTGKVVWTGEPVATLITALGECVSVMERELNGLAVIQPELKAAREALAAASHAAPAWTGEGLPPVGTVCEVLWNESRMEYLRTKVFGVNEHGQPIHRFDEGPKQYQYQADALVSVLGTKVFRPLRTPEHIAGEERQKIAMKMVKIMGEARRAQPDTGIPPSEMAGSYAYALYDAGYRLQDPEE